MRALLARSSLGSFRWRMAARPDATRVSTARPVRQTAFNQCQPRSKLATAREMSLHWHARTPIHSMCHRRPLELRPFRTSSRRAVIISDDLDLAPDARSAAQSLIGRKQRHMQCLG